MKLEEQVINLELAKRLKELGVEQNSIFDWVYGFDGNKGQEDWFLWLMSPYNRKNLKWKEQYSAFTAAELLEMLPYYDNKTEPGNISYGIQLKELRKELGGKYYCVEDVIDYPHETDFHSDNFADCLAMMLIHLIENNIWNPQNE